MRRHGRSEQAEAEFDKELSLYREAIKKDPGDAEVHGFFAKALFDRRRSDEGLNELREALRIAPSSDPFGSVGSEFYSSGRVDQAIALYRNAVRLKPADARSHNDLGCYLLDFGEAEFALAEIREALRTRARESILPGQPRLGELALAI